MKKTLLILFLSALSTYSLRSQCVGNCSVYAVSQLPTFTLFPTTGIDAVPSFSQAGVQNKDDGYTPPVPIGFNFNFFCTTYSTVLIYTNGLLQFDIGVPSTFPFGYDAAQLLPNPSFPTVLNGIVCFRMDDLDETLSGSVTYTTVGVSPNQKFVLTYSNVPLYGNNSLLYSGQIVLYQTTNIIDIYTISAPQGPNLSTQGIEDASGTLAAATPSLNQTIWPTITNQGFRFAPYVAMPPSSLSGSTLFCQGDASAFQASFIPTASSYNWTLPSGWIGTSTLSTITASAGASGTISVTTSYTCGTSAPTILTVSVTPAPIIGIGNPTPAVICSGKTTTITASGATSYILNPGGFNGVPPFVDMPLTTTVYTLSGTNSQGCKSINNPTTSITVQDTPSVTVNSGSICLGQTFTINPAGAANFVVTGNFFNVSPLAPGPYSYTVVGTSTNGCVGDPVVSALTVYSLPTVGIVASRTLICLKENAVLSGTGATSYAWGNSLTSPSITVSPTTNTFYTITGTDIHGCVNTATLNFAVKPCTGIEELTEGFVNMKIYPNPSNGIFDVKLNSVSENTHIEIYNGVGQLIHSELIQSEITSVNLKAYSNGFYYIKIKNAEREEVKKLIKQ